MQEGKTLAQTSVSDYNSKCIDRATTKHIFSLNPRLSFFAVLLSAAWEVARDER